MSADGQMAGDWVARIGRVAAAPLNGAAPAIGLAVTGLYKAFGDHPVLQGVDLEVPEGTVTGILGPSGSGKTTLLRLLAGFAQPDRGTITIAGRLMDGPGRRVGPQQRGVGYVPQEGSLFPHLDVKANVGFGVPRSQRRRKVGELLEMVGLDGMAGRYPHQLSGGQQQRVALARALARDPSLVLLDEPFSSLDAALRSSVRRDITAILSRAGTTTVMVTHDQEEAFSMADQVAVLRGGKVSQIGPPDRVYSEPVDADMARFVGEANLVAGTVRGGYVVTAFGPLPLSGPVAASDRTDVTVLLRPEQIRLRAAGVGPAGAVGDAAGAVEDAAGAVGDAAGAVEGTVLRREYHGHDSLVVVSVADSSVIDGEGGTVTVRCSGAASPEPGSPVLLRAVGPVMAWGSGPAGSGTAGSASVPAEEPEPSSCIRHP